MGLGDWIGRLRGAAVSASRSNLVQWQELQDRGYFANHPVYRGTRLEGGGDLAIIERFVPLRPDMVVAVIGCGYGRDSAQIAPRVRHVYVDVTSAVLEQARAFLAARGIANFTPVLAERYREEIPSGIDLVYAITVMQHLTRDLVREYVATLGAKLAPGGGMVVQFLELLDPRAARRDAELKVYEPSVSWTCQQIAMLVRASGLAVGEIVTSPVGDHALWHWLHCRPAR